MAFYNDHLLSIDEKRNLINTLDANALHGINPAPRSLDIDPKDKEASVVGNNLVAFVAGMKRANKNAVKRTLLFAQKAADADKRVEKGTPEWFDVFVYWMSVCGWTKTNGTYSRYNATEKRFTMDELGLKFLTSAVAAVVAPGPASVIVAKVATEAVQALASQNSPLRMFESQARSHAGGEFGIASCFESDEDVYMAMGIVGFDSNSNNTNVLFWEWQSQDVAINSASTSWVLDLDAYEDVEATVRAKLGDSARRAIADLVLP